MKYEQIVNRRKIKPFTEKDREVIRTVKRKTKKGSLDNISRTVHYYKYYQRHQDVQWTFLASMVSRNAGWNMTDLKGHWYPRVLSQTYCKFLFFTYERANWLIFVDAYPQLLLYAESVKRCKPLFYLLRAFHVSVYMELEWEKFWQKRDRDRLCTAQIINEQQVIQKPVIEHPLYQRKVFRTLPFRLQEMMHFSTVIFPTSEGRLYGFSVYHFNRIEQRILLGKRLAWLLFNSPVRSQFQNFARHTSHTGMRYDYERYVLPENFRPDTPLLRAAYPVIPHRRSKVIDWYKKGMNVKSYFASVHIPETYDLTDWYPKKRKQLQAGVLLYEWVQMHKK